RLVLEQQQVAHVRRAHLGELDRAGGRGSGASLAAHLDATGEQRVVEPRRRHERWVALPAAARDAAVEAERAQRTDVLRDPVARGRAAAQRVERRLVADHGAGDGLEAGLAELAGERLDARARAVRVAREGAA